MATVLRYQTWSGGDGRDDPQIHLLECKEDPVEVLALVFKTHEIYSYKGIYTPVDSSYPNNAQGLVISEILNYPGEIISKHGLSIHHIDMKQVKGYNDSIGRSTKHFEQRAVFHLKHEFESKLYFGYKGMEKLKPLIGTNYFLMRDSDVINELRQDNTEIYYFYPNESRSEKPFIPSEWIEEQEKKLQVVFEIAKTITGISSIEELIPLYEKYNEIGSEIY